MKAKIISLLILVLFTQVKAQDYLISFAGAGAGTTVDSVKVQNLVQGTELTLNGSDTLNLVLVVGIPETGSAKGNMLTVWPNPVHDEGTIRFDAPVQGVVVVTVTDVAGRVVLQSEQSAQAGSNAFCVSGLRSGIYSVNIHSPSYWLSGKLISTGSDLGTAAIRNIQDDGKTAVLKAENGTRSVLPMQYNDGEQLLFTGYSGTYATVVPLVPAQSMTLTFNFVDCIDAQGGHYPVITVGSQLWMAKNLNVGTRINGSLNQSNNGIIEKYCNNDDEANCDTYGGLYQWHELMQYLTTQGVQGLCPAGWHIATDAEWTILTTCLGGESVAGGKLKSTFGWYNNGNGTNTSGFTILPGGSFDPIFGYSDITYAARFWTSTKGGGPFSWFRYLGYDDDGVGRYTTTLIEGYSCRCLKDYDLDFPAVTTSAVMDIVRTTATSGGNVTADGGSPVTVRGVCWSTSADPTISNSHTTDGSGLGTFTSYLTGLMPGTMYYMRAYATNIVGTAYGDQLTFTTLPFSCPETILYEGKTYATVVIGAQCWFRENLNVGTQISGSQNQTNNGIIEKYCYNDDENNCNIYGGLYQWDEAMQYVTTEGEQGICPSGWHIPTDTEWTKLSDSLGGETVAGGKIKEVGTVHWAPPNTGATNSSGFTALPGSYRDISGNFYDLTRKAYFYSSTRGGVHSSWYRYLFYNNEILGRTNNNKNYGFSCRCLQD